MKEKEALAQEALPLGERRCNLLTWGDGVGTGLERNLRRSGTDIFHC